MYLQARFRKSICSWFGFDLPLAQRAVRIKAAGFDAATIWWGNEESAETRNRPDIIRDAGLILENVHVPFEGCNDLWSSDHPTRMACVDRHKRWLADCAQHRVPTMVMHVTKGVIDTPRHNGIDSISAILAEAEKLGIVLAIENTRCRLPLDMLFGTFNTAALCMCYDSSHDWLYGEKKTDILRAWGGRLSTVHFSDNDGVTDKHWLPGEGVVDWVQVAKAYPSQSYKGYLSIESVPTDNDNKEGPERFLGKAIERARWIEGLIINHCENHSQ